MRVPSETQKQILRHLAAARFYLPVVLRQPEDYNAESQYAEFLHHTEYELALQDLENLGNLNSGFAEEELFWSELLTAARLMGLSENVSACEERLATLTLPR